MRDIIAGDVMTPNILKVDETSTVTELASFLLDHQITGAVVINEDGTPIGVVSSTDIAAVAAESGDSLESVSARRNFYEESWADTFDDADQSGIRLMEAEVRVGDIMTPELISVPVDMPLGEVARLMLDSHLHRVLVMAEDDFVGILTTSDLLGLLVADPE